MNVALGGSQSDGTVLPERQFSSDWDGAWYSGTAITENGWSAEIFLPWSQVGMPRSGSQRTINVAFSRKLASRDEYWGLPALPRSQPLYMSVMQPWQLEGLRRNNSGVFSPTYLPSWICLKVVPRITLARMCFGDRRQIFRQRPRYGRILARWKATMWW